MLSGRTRVIIANVAVAFRQKPIMAAEGDINGGFFDMIKLRGRSRGKSPVSGMMVTRAGGICKAETGGRKR